MASSTQKPSSLTLIHKHSFEVFLSFRGEDTRYNFTDHLFVELDRMAIHTFRDNQLERGEEIKSELLKTIEESRISIVVFSENYAHSKWCLDELAKIMECRKEMAQIVYPVFYHVDPSDVRKQTRSFGEAFSIHERNVEEERVQRWRAAMTEASNLSGCHVNDGYESGYIKEIIDVILKRLDLKLLHVDDGIVGMDLRLKELKSLINSHLHNVRVVGIYGIGGIGKTTMAKLVYNEIQCEFHGASFLENVKERFEKGCQLQLQEELLHGILGQKIELSNINDGINKMKSRLHSKKVLIVMDDVDHLNQLESIVGSRKWFGEGSIIVVTTRDQHLLDNYGVDITYEAKELHYEEAIQLFSMHAFKQMVPKDDYIDLSEHMVDYAQGLPLALKVLGAFLHGMTIDEWKSASNKLKKYLKKEINDVLRISFDALDHNEKNVFLDIACFFKGQDKAFVLSILDSCNLFATCNIRVLCNRCLITISNNKVKMHDLIQQMGWSIVREECLEDPSKWSRLWDLDDIDKAFSKGKGMKNTETISLDLSRSKEIQLSSKALANMKKVFATMKKLRLLKIYYSDDHSLMRREYKVFIPKDFEFPPNLIYLHWEGYTSKTLPSNFCGDNLVALNLKFSNMKELWKSDKHLAELKFMDLSYSQQLIKIPRMPKLKRLNLEGCTSFHNLDSSIGVFHDLKFYLTKFLRKLNFSETGIEELPNSIGSLASLEMLNLSQCSKFKKFPDIFANMGCLRKLDLHHSGIEELPSSIGSSTSLEVLNLTGCSKFKKFPDIFANMGCLKELYLRGCGIEELPSSVGFLTSLKVLKLSNCLKFKKFPDIFANMGCLRKLNLRNSSIEELPSSIGSSTSLEILDLSWCSKFKKFPDIFANMRCLRKLKLQNTGIEELPSSIGSSTSLEILNLAYCSKFKKFPDIFANMRCLKHLYLDSTAIKELPNNIGCLEALTFLSLNNCSRLEKLPEFQSNMGSVRRLSGRGTAIKELPCSMGPCPRLQRLVMTYCKNLTSISNSIFELKSLKYLNLIGCSNLEIFPEIIEDMEHLEQLYLCESAITKLPSSIDCLKYLRSLELSRCKNLETLPNSIGNLTCLRTLLMRNCPKLHKLPDNLRSLQCCLEELDISGCNMMEGVIPSDLWHLFSLVLLNVSENNICCIPIGIIQLSKLGELCMNHCPMLEEIPELPSSLWRIEAHGCPLLETVSSDPVHLLWSYLLNCFKSQIQDFVEGTFVGHTSNHCKVRKGTSIVVPGRSGIPKWISHKSMGHEIQIELPKNWYEDNNFLGFALFCHYAPLDDDICHLTPLYRSFYDNYAQRSDDDICAHTLDLLGHNAYGLFRLWISHGDQFEPVNTMRFERNYTRYVLCSNSLRYRLIEQCDRDIRSCLDPTLNVVYFPQIAITSKYRSSGWNKFKACFSCPFECNGKAVLKVESCGIHLIYNDAQDHHQQSLQLFNVKRRHDDIEDHPLKKKSRHV